MESPPATLNLLHGSHVFYYSLCHRNVELVFIRSIKIDFDVGTKIEWFYYYFTEDTRFSMLHIRINFTLVLLSLRKMLVIFPLTFCKKGRTSIPSLPLTVYTLAKLLKVDSLSLTSNVCCGG